MTKRLLIGLAALVALSCTETKSVEDPMFSGSDLQIGWKLNQNQYKGEFNYSNTLVIKNISQSSDLKGDWSIYFNQLPKKLIEVPSIVNLEHINGDLYKISPNESTKALMAGDSLVIDFVCNDWVIKNIDAPCGFYIVIDDQAQAIEDIKITPFSAERAKRFDGDIMPITTNESRFDDYVKLQTIDKTNLTPIIPTPASYIRNDGTFELGAELSYSIDDELKSVESYLSSVIAKEVSINVSPVESEAQLTIQKVESLSEEAYKLEVSSEGVLIQATTDKGAFYGLQSFLALASSNNEIQNASIEDEPRFAYRGMHLDVGRNFQPKASILKLLDYMAFYKLNKFHFHLSDDEGWRMEIPSLPELTSYGAFRGHTVDEKDFLRPAYGSGHDKDNSYGSGYYSKADYIEILKYAAERNIDVIPEFDLPGHARAAIKAMDKRYDRLMAEGEQEAAEEFLLRDLGDTSSYSSVQRYNDNVLCVCKPSVYNFIETVISDVVDIYAEANHTLEVVHIGADEVPNGVWEGSPICQAFKEANDIESKADFTYYFLQKYYEILQEKNLTMGGWEEVGMIEGETAGSHVVNEAMADKNVQPYVWNNVWGWGMEDFAYKLANTGYNVVLSNATNLYFDLAYNKDPEENGYYWAGFCNARKTFEFTPMDVFKSAYEDRMGNKLNDSMWVDKTRLTEEGASRILGIQGQLWSETVRSSKDLEYYLYPKLIGLAERAWSPQPEWATIEDQQERLEALDGDWLVFANRIGQLELPRMNTLFGGVNYRVSSGEKNGKVVYEFPGFKK